MPKHSLEKLQAVAKAKGFRIDVAQGMPSPVIYVLDLKRTLNIPGGIKGHPCVYNPQTGMPNFGTLHTVSKFLEKC